MMLLGDKYVIYKKQYMIIIIIASYGSYNII